jgi:hypothetical protein
MLKPSVALPKLSKASSGEAACADPVDSAIAAKTLNNLLVVLAVFFI